MRWILILAILLAATPPLLAVLYLRATLLSASGRASAASIEIRRRLLRMIVR